MISAFFHEGSGLGDQLFRYVTLRTIAEEKGYQWGMLRSDIFKGKSFMDIDFGEVPKVDFLETATRFLEKETRDQQGIDIRSYDPEINFIQDNTVIDGCFEDEKYWGNRLDDMRDWLAVEPITVDDNVCVIGFRGGEYSLFPDLYLDNSYWTSAIKHMRDKGIDRFEIHTDDKKTAEAFANTLFAPYNNDRYGNWIDYKVIQDIGINWRSVRYAKHLIIPNSAFYILPALLGEADEVIAPRYWARRNIKTWARPACYYKDKRFQYI
jgi:hypothetical protein